MDRFNLTIEQIFFLYDNDVICIVIYENSVIFHRIKQSYSEKKDLVLPKYYPK